MNEFVAAMGICNLRHLDAEIEKRKSIDKKYREILGDIKGLRLNNQREDVESNYAYFPIIVENDFACTRDELFEKFLDENIFVDRRFYPLVSAYNCFHGEYGVFDTPVAKSISEQVLLLPLYSDLNTEDLKRICQVIM